MKELSRIAQAANDLMVERVIQTQLSTDDSKETPPKKKKGAQGSASVSGSIGNATRGSADREAKRKVPRSDDDVTMASRRSIQSHRSSHSNRSARTGIDVATVVSTSSSKKHK